MPKRTAGVYKRANSEVWWISYTGADGTRIRQSSGTTDYKQAEALRDTLKAKAWEESKLGAKPTYHWQELVIRYVEELDQSNKSEKSKENDMAALRFLDVFMRNKTLDQINTKLIADITTARAKPYTKTYQSGQVRECRPGPDTVNRFLTSFRAAFNRAVAWGWIDSVPKIPKIAGEKKRDRWITKDQAKVLLQHLPAHLSAMAEFTLETGLRKSNVTGLRWQDVDLQARAIYLKAETMKTRRALTLPLSARAVEILEMQTGKHPELVFSYRGQEIEKASTRAWRNALEKSGIHDFHWHDLRHTWASWHAQGGTPMHVLQKLGGWQTPAMVQRYAHLGMDDLKRYAEQVRMQESPPGYVLATPEKT